MLTWSNRPTIGKLRYDNRNFRETRYFLRKPPRTNRFAHDNQRLLDARFEILFKEDDGTKKAAAA